MIKKKQSLSVAFNNISQGDITTVTECNNPNIINYNSTCVSFYAVPGASEAQKKILKDYLLFPKCNFFFIKFFL